MFRSIVVGIDGSDPSRRALDAACQIAQAFDSEVHLVHAIEGGPPEDPDPVITEAVAKAKVVGVTPASTTSGEGDPFEELMTVVGLYGADLVITGRRGLGGLSGLFAGSTSQKIAQHADCAFLTIK